MSVVILELIETPSLPLSLPPSLSLSPSLSRGTATLSSDQQNTWSHRAARVYIDFLVGEVVSSSL